MAPTAPPAVPAPEALSAPAAVGELPAPARTAFPAPPPMSPTEAHQRRLQQCCQPAPAPARRGQRQRAHRQREEEVRASVVSWSGWAEEQELTPTEVAARLHLAPRTLRQWQQLSRRRLVLLGRPLHRAPVALRNAVLHWLDEAGPATGLPALQTHFPVVARAELADLLTRYRRVWRRRHGQALHVLHGTAAGAVWALDFAEAPRPVEGSYPSLRAVRDLGSGRQLLWLPVAEATAGVPLAALASLVALYSAPLVLKADNGSAFGAAATQAWAAAVGMELLYSPPGCRRPMGRSRRALAR